MAGYAKHFLSPSTIDDFLKCPRCFWLNKVKKIKQPRGAFPSLPGGLDKAIKTYCDGYRAKGQLPPQFAGRVEGVLFKDQATLGKMRYWKTSPLCFTDERLSVRVAGAIDELMVSGVAHSPLDYKSRASAHKEGADPFQYYRNQLNTYDLMLEQFGLKTSGRAYLTYWTPAEVEGQRAGLIETSALIRFDVQVYDMATDPASAMANIEAAVECLEGGLLPDPSPTCEVCPFIAAAAMAVAE